jgi:hypothetical protein
MNVYIRRSYARASRNETINKMAGGEGYVTYRRCRWLRLYISDNDDDNNNREKA